MGKAHDLRVLRLRVSGLIHCSRPFFTSQLTHSVFFSLPLPLPLPRPLLLCSLSLFQRILSFNYSLFSLIFSLISVSRLIIIWSIIWSFLFVYLIP